MGSSQNPIRPDVGSSGFPLPLTFDDSTSASSVRILGVCKLFRRVISFPVMLAVLLVGAGFVSGRLFLVDPDLWWHLKVGESILQTHRWPTTDPYSFTVSGQPWVEYEWLADVLLAVTARIGGLRALDALLIVLGGAILVALYSLATLRTGNSKAAFIASAILLPLVRPFFSLRPQMLGYLFLVLTLICLERFRQGHRRWIWLLPVLLLIWVNTHGFWIIGLGAVLAYWVGGLFDFRLGDLYARRWSPENRCRISLVFLLCLCALPITPYGARLAPSPFEYAFSLPLNSSSILEWQPLHFDLMIAKLFLACFFFFIVVQIVFRFAWRLEELGLLVFGTLMMCLHVRFMVIFVPFFLPLLAGVLARWVPRYQEEKDVYALNALLILLTLTGIFVFFPKHYQLQAAVSKAFPAEGVAYLDKHPVPEPMFNSYGFGGYLIWARGPEHKVFIDGRGDVYERGGVLSDYKHIAGIGPGSLAVLRAYGIRSCLLERDSPAATVLAASGDWRRVYLDNVSVLFVWQGDSPAALPNTTRAQGIELSLTRMK